MFQPSLSLFFEIGVEREGEWEKNEDAEKIRRLER
jgi:hypothetical protein